MDKRDAEEVGGEERFIWQEPGKEVGWSEGGSQRKLLTHAIWKCHNDNNTLYANFNKYI